MRHFSSSCFKVSAALDAQLSLANVSRDERWKVTADIVSVFSDIGSWDRRRLGVARIRTLRDGKPTSALLLETAPAELETGYLEGNIRNTRANFSRSREKVEAMLAKPNVGQRDW